MSHEHLRKERNCLNCGATVAGDYCQNCGQRNVVPRQTFWHLVTHFFNDITHFDGKFFSTMKQLLFHPGFLSEEWVKGRRTKYLDPIRMYLFISALFLILLGSFVGVVPPVKYYAPDSEAAQTLKHYREEAALEGGFEFTWTSFAGDSTGEEGVWILSLNKEYMHGRAYYDSIQQSLPASKRDNFIERYFSVRTVAAYEAYDQNPYSFFPNTIEKFIHSSSKIFFVSLPIFSFLLWLFYIRSRKNYYFVSHAIFSVHYYCVAFLLLALFFISMSLTEYLPESIYSAITSTVALLIGLSFFVYLLIAMRQFYKQNWFKTTIKAISIFLIQSVLLAILMVVFAFNSFFSMAAH